MRIVVAPDKFKGSLTAVEVARAVAAGVARLRPEADVRLVPLADGGDGTVDAAVAAGYERIPVPVEGPTGAPVLAAYARRGERAVVELANACGLGLLPGGVPAPLDASSYGLGQVLAAALDAGVRAIALGVGGSASTDGGAGMLQALGARVLTADGTPVRRGGRGLSEVARVELGPLRERLAGVSVELAGDVDNLLLGPSGAAAVYGPQKGATAADVRQLDAGLANWAAALAALTGVDCAAAPGAGAAGGVGFAALAALGAHRRAGVDVVAEVVGLAAAIRDADLVVTGEGSLDEQTLHGKTVAGVARLAGALRVPVLAVAGRVTLSAEQQRQLGLERVVALTDLEPDPRRCLAEADRLVAAAVERLLS